MFTDIFTSHLHSSKIFIHTVTVTTYPYRKYVRLRNYVRVSKYAYLVQPELRKLTNLLHAYQSKLVSK